MPVEMYRKKKTARDTASVGSALAVLAIIPFDGERVKRFPLNSFILCRYDYDLVNGIRHLKPGMFKC